MFSGKGSIVDTYLTVLFLSLIGLNAFYGILMIHIQRKSNERENRLLKAVIAKNLSEYSIAEANPAEKIKLAEVENDLAIKAVEIEKEQNKRDRDQIIPIT